MADADTRALAAHHYTPAIRDYCEALHATPDAAQRFALGEQSRAGLPGWHISPTDGRMLEWLTALIGARRVVEVGTLGGYSALWLARGLEPEGELFTLEADASFAQVARHILDRAEALAPHPGYKGLARRARVIVGRAAETLPSIERFGPFDLVFLDANKDGYRGYAEWAFAHLRPGGLLVADNAFLFGYLAGREPDGQETAARIDAMRAFHQFLAEHFRSMVIPTAEGLAVGVKPSG